VSARRARRLGLLVGGCLLVIASVLAVVPLTVEVDGSAASCGPPLLALRAPSEPGDAGFNAVDDACAGAGVGRVFPAALLGGAAVAVVLCSRRVGRRRAAVELAVEHRRLDGAALGEPVVGCRADRGRPTAGRVFAPTPVRNLAGSELDGACGQLIRLEVSQQVARRCAEITAVARRGPGSRGREDRVCDPRPGTCRVDGLRTAPGLPWQDARGTALPWVQISRARMSRSRLFRSPRTRRWATRLQPWWGRIGKLRTCRCPTFAPNGATRVCLCE
jgi:hypothetical protein